MKNTLRILLCLVLAFAAVFTMVACDNNDDESSSSSSSSASVYKIYFDYSDWDGAEADDDFEEEIEVNAGEKIGTLPELTLDGYTFKGWYTEEDYDALLDGDDATKIKKSWKPTEDTTLYAWFEAEDASSDDGQQSSQTPVTPTYDCESGNHKWGMWSYVDPTCTTAGSKTRSCDLCGERYADPDYPIDNPKTGHAYGSYVVGVMKKVATCENCGDEDEVTLKNVATSATRTEDTGKGLYGGQDFAAFANGSWDDSNMALRGGDYANITFTFNSGYIVEQICVAGKGSCGYTVSVWYEGDSDWTQIGTGAFNAGGYENATVFTEIDSTRKVLEVKINMPSSSDGVDYWQECQIGVAQ